ncbi:MAG: right-handed parallel beta-helix repeat-containing protein [Promethearchaeota archaeon]
MNGLKSFFLCLLLLISIVWIVNYEGQPNGYVFDPFKLLVSKSNLSQRSTRITHAPIFIYGDEDFITQATAENWPGEGTKVNPIIIEGYTITATEGPLISISDTIFYFIIRNNLLNGSHAPTEGIHFSNVQHGTIENNIICNNAAVDGGIIFEFASKDNLIINNSIFGNQMGMNIRGQHNSIINNSVYQNNEMAIWLNTDTINSTVVGNTIYNSTGSGILLEETYSNFISKNLIYRSEVNGIDLIHTSGNVIENNTISNTVLGISLWESSQNNVSSNHVFNNMGGISLYYSTENSIYNNTTRENHNLGVDLEMSSHNNTFSTNKMLKNGIVGAILFDSDFNTFTENIFYDNNMEGIRIEGNTNYNIFTFNNFTDNYTPQHQAKDGGLNNIFAFNFWNDWTSPDNNLDGFVDEPYPMKGTAGNQDSHPLVTLTMNHTHLIYKPKLLLPHTPLSGIVTLTWIESLDSLKHDITYAIYYSPDQGEQWINLASNLTVTHFNWDTTTVGDASSYLLKIEAKCDKGLIVDEISNTFTIDNTFPGGEFVIQLFILVASLIVVAGVGYFLYTSKTRVPKTIIEFFQSDQIDFFKSLYGKVLIGLENITAGVIPESKGFPLLEPVEPATLVEYFPFDIKEDLISGLKGRTVLTLIEIAYQYPEESNPMKLAKTLDIPPTTVSYEINRLRELEYLEPFVSTQVLKDGRFRNYTITPKGTSFLRTLKGALELSIRRLREKDSFQ